MRAREPQFCDCGHRLTVRDLVQGLCSGCGVYLSEPDWDEWLDRK